jgi:hypothetical protein
MHIAKTRTTASTVLAMLSSQKEDRAVDSIPPRKFNSVRVFMRRAKEKDRAK